MKFARVRAYALSLPDVSEEPHFNYASFRVRGKIFVTAPPNEEHVHVFVSEEQREPALAIYPEFLEKLTWGAKVVGLRVRLANAQPAVVDRLVGSAWLHKAPKSLAKTFGAMGGAVLAAHHVQAPDSSIEEGTASSRLRRLKPAAHVKR